MDETIKTILETELEQKDLIFPFVADLTLREKEVLRRRESETLEAVGEKMEISKERVRQIEAKAKQKITYKKEIIKTLSEKIGEKVFTEDEVETAFIEYQRTLGVEFLEGKNLWQDFCKKLWELKVNKKLI